MQKGDRTKQKKNNETKKKRRIRQRVESRGKITRSHSGDAAAEERGSLRTLARIAFIGGRRGET
jgi:hypothetical protein